MDMRQELSATLMRANWRQIPAKPIDEWIVACDLGQSQDFTAICALHHRVVVIEGEASWVADDTRQIWKQSSIETLEVRHLERLPLQTPYPAQVAHVGNLLQRPPLNHATLVIDDTGVGRAVGDLFDQAQLKAERVTITAGNEVTQPGFRKWHVAKSILISCLDARLHTGELKIAKELTDAPALQAELADFRRSVSAAGRASYGARVGSHDDLVLAVAIAVWFATGRVRNTVTWQQNAF